MSNLKAIKIKSKALFDVISVQEAVDICNLDGLIISHPFVNTGIVALYSNKNYELVDITKNQEDFEKFRIQTFHLIDKAKDVWGIMKLINKPYLFYWFKINRHYFDKKDYAKMLAEIWTISENPNDDVNVSIDEAIEYFKVADKNFLMNKDELDIYNAIPEKITVYRGVSKNRNPDGLSYSLLKEKAEWFQRRFADKDNPGFLIEKEIKKENVLAFFGRRSEAEIVVDVRAVND